MTPRDTDPLDVTEDRLLTADDIRAGLGYQVDWFGMHPTAAPDRFVVPPRSLASQTYGDRPPVSGRLAGLLLAALSGALVAGALMFFVGRASAAPRSAAPAIEAWHPIEASLDPDVAQSAERRFPDLRDAEVAGSSPALGANGGASPSPAVGSHPILDVPIESMPATSEIGTALEGGTATWYRDPSRSGYYAAAPWYRFGDPLEHVTVCNRSGDCIEAVVGDFCGCPGDRIIDLAPSAFSQLAPLSKGVVAVTVERGGPSVTVPPTDR